MHHYNYYANAWNWTTYPRPRMATEYGFQSLPSAHAWNEAADPFQDDDWSYQGQLLDSRQHHPLGNIEMDLQIQLRLGPPRTHRKTFSSLSISLTGNCCWACYFLVYLLIVSIVLLLFFEIHKNDIKGSTSYGILEVTVSILFAFKSMK